MLLHLNRPVRTETLVDAVWGERAGDRAERALNTHIWRLRRLLEPQRDPRQPTSVLLTDIGGYRLMVSVDQVSSARFEKLTSEVVDLLTSDQPRRALAAADEALGLWVGPPFVDLAEQLWASGSVARLEELHLQLVERRLDALLAVGDPEQVISDGWQLLQEHRLRERLWAQQMLARYRAGRADDALGVFQQARRVLLDETGLDPSAELIELHQRMLRRDSSLLLPSSPARSATARPVEVYLPRSPTLIGRDGDRAKIEGLLEQSSLVTIVGSAGCGKTSLAVDIAHRVASGFADGARFVDLGEVVSGQEVTSHLVSTLDLTPSATDSPADAVRAFGRGRQALIVLDNCETVLAAAADVAALLTEPGSSVTVLATSRLSLSIDGEQVARLGPLATTAPRPDRHGGDRDPTHQTTAESPAFELFLARDQLQRQLVDLTPGERAAVDRICVAVDGLPLAVELAASWTEAYSLDEIADQVRTDPGSLSAVGNRQAKHHRSLFTAIEQSYQLLELPAQALHRRLSVVPGSFDRTLAESLVEEYGDTEDLERREVAGLLARLVHCSLLSADPTSGPTTFRQLAAVRSHAARQLARANGVGAAVAGRDAWTVALVRRRPPLGRPELANWVAEVTGHLSLVRATLHESLVVHPAPLGVEVACGLLDYCYYGGWVHEGLEWVQRADTLAWGDGPTGPSSRRALTGLTLASLLAFDGQSYPARRALDRSATLLREQPDPEMVWPLLSAAAAFSLTYDATSMRTALGLAQGDLGRNATDDQQVAADTIACMAAAFEGRGEVEQALDCYERATRLGNLWVASLACNTIMARALATADPELGLPWARRLLALQDRVGAHTAPQRFEVYAGLLVQSGEDELAVRAFSASFDAARRVSARWPRNRLTPDLLATARRSLGETAFDRAWALGRDLRNLEDIGPSEADPVVIVV